VRSIDSPGLPCARDRRKKIGETFGAISWSTFAIFLISCVHHLPHHLQRQRQRHTAVAGFLLRMERFCFGPEALNFRKTA
jgi:hypothetical protein